MGAAWLWWAAECYGRRVPPLRVVIADDSLLIREGVARVLVDAGLEVVGRAGDGEELLGVVAAERPDVVVVDIRMPPTHTDEGVRAAREIRRRFPGTGVLVLSQYAEPEYVVELLQDGASGIGYLLKDRIAEVEDFGAAVRRLAARRLGARSGGRRADRDPGGAQRAARPSRPPTWSA